ncbi:hypothetical protein GGD46_005826 [Rhizobium lusitanum]|uniref:Uncharacterized protein n=1 Tax=Rhizobium lusitanum TaxID=293958 RepID=A0A7X0IWV2_9HYPH|nr:hypothetical protein [Rhizobium lusitanum]
MKKIIVFGLFCFLPPLHGFACTTARGVNYAAINAGQVLIEGVVQSVHIDQDKGDYVFDVAVRTTLKGAERPSWTIRTRYMELGEISLDAWAAVGTVYIGFDVIDDTLSVGRFQNLGCRPYGIVRATPSNLDKIKRNVQEPSIW